MLGMLPHSTVYLALVPMDEVLWLPVEAILWCPQILDILRSAHRLNTVRNAWELCQGNYGKCCYKFSFLAKVFGNIHRGYFKRIRPKECSQFLVYSSGFQLERTD